MANEKYCTECGSVAKPKKFTKGSILIEIVLWLCFFVPGIIYSLWRVTTKYEGCRECGGKTVIPLTSPVARAALGTGPRAANS